MLISFFELRYDTSGPIQVHHFLEA